MKRSKSNNLGRLATVMCCAIAVLMLSCLPGLASAEVLEITPFVAFKAGELAVDENVFRHSKFEIENGAAWGVILGVPLGRGFQLELLYESMETTVENGLRIRDLDLENLHVGGLYAWRLSQVEPYVAVSAGATRFGLESSQSLSRFSASMGSGIKLFASDHVGFRFDHRWWISRVEVGDPLICTEDTCDRDLGHEYFVQVDLRVGLVLRF